MSKDRLWIFGGVALMLVIVVGGWLVGISPQLDQVSAVSAQTATIQAANGKSTTDLAALRTQFAHIGTFRSALNKLRGSIPETAGASAFLNELTVLAAANGVTLTDVEVGSATLYAAPTAAVTPPATTSTDTSSTPAPAATAAPATTPTQSVGGGLVLVPVTISAKGAFDSIRDFLGAVQKGTRLYFASSSSMSTDSTGGTTGTLTGDAFTLQGTSDVVTKTKLIPTPAATVTPTVTPTPTPTPTNSTTTSSAKTGNTAPSTAPSTAPTSTPVPTDTPAGP